MGNAVFNNTLFKKNVVFSSYLISLAGLNKIGNGPDIFEDVLSKIKNAEARNNELKNSRKQQESTNFHLRLR